MSEGETEYREGVGWVYRSGTSGAAKQSAYEESYKRSTQGRSVSGAGQYRAKAPTAEEKGWANTTVQGVNKATETSQGEQEQKSIGQAGKNYGVMTQRQQQIINDLALVQGGGRIYSSSPELQALYLRGQGKDYTPGEIAEAQKVQNQIQQGGGSYFLAENEQQAASMRAGSMGEGVGTGARSEETTLPESARFKPGLGYYLPESPETYFNFDKSGKVVYTLMDTGQVQPGGLLGLRMEGAGVRSYFSQPATSLTFEFAPTISQERVRRMARNAGMETLEISRASPLQANEVGIGGFTISGPGVKVAHETQRIFEEPTSLFGLSPASGIAMSAGGFVGGAAAGAVAAEYGLGAGLVIGGGIGSVAGGHTTRALSQTMSGQKISSPGLFDISGEFALGAGLGFAGYVAGEKVGEAVQRGLKANVKTDASIIGRQGDTAISRFSSEGEIFGKHFRTSLRASGHGAAKPSTLPEFESVFVGTGKAETGLTQPQKFGLAGATLKPQKDLTPFVGISTAPGREAEQFIGVSKEIKPFMDLPGVQSSLFVSKTSGGASMRGLTHVEDVLGSARPEVPFIVPRGASPSIIGVPQAGGKGGTQVLGLMQQAQGGLSGLKSVIGAGVAAQAIKQIGMKAGSQFFPLAQAGRQFQITRTKTESGSAILSLPKVDLKPSVEGSVLSLSLSKTSMVSKTRQPQRQAQFLRPGTATSLFQPTRGMSLQQTGQRVRPTQKNPLIAIQRERSQALQRQFIGNPQQIRPIPRQTTGSLTGMMTGLKLALTPPTLPKTGSPFGIDLRMNESRAKYRRGFEYTSQAAAVLFGWEAKGKAPKGVIGGLRPVYIGESKPRKKRRRK